MSLKIIGVGNLTGDVKLGKSSDKKTTYATFGMAFNDKLRNETVFINCISFGKGAEIIGKYLSKGSPLFIVGRLREWINDDELKNYSVAIDEFQFLGNKVSSNTDDDADDYEDDYGEELPKKKTRRTRNTGRNTGRSNRGKSKGGGCPI